jgi:hypothetical protein
VASIRKRDGRWRVQVRKRGYKPQFGSFTQKPEAIAWARQDPITGSLSCRAPAASAHPAAAPPISARNARLEFIYGTLVEWWQTFGR